MPVFNLHRRGLRPDDVYVGRPGRGVDGYFGNPVRRSQTCQICGEVHLGKGTTLACFEVWARQRLEEDPEYRQKVSELHGKNLVCFCAPKPCHASILERLAGELNPAPPPEPNPLEELFS